jgi:hypothetical protein
VKTYNPTMAYNLTDGLSLMLAAVVIVIIIVLFKSIAEFSFWEEYIT